jgi:hypothetical protein
MALSFPDVGENLALEMIVNKTAAQNLVLKLYSNNITPAEGDTAATYTEATFAGYVAKTLTGATWNAAAAGSIAYSAAQTFTRSSTGANETIYGYFVIQTTSTVLLYSERDGAAPFNVTNAGDAVTLTPTITAN